EENAAQAAESRQEQLEQDLSATRAEQKSLAREVQLLERRLGQAGKLLSRARERESALAVRLEWAASALDQERVRRERLEMALAEEQRQSAHLLNLLREREALAAELQAELLRGGPAAITPRCPATSRTMLKGWLASWSPPMLSRPAEVA
ncbi:MAG: hypothetical protein AB1758_37005, partial [Candidatus Eremiobacterota bacterium]